MSTFVVHYQTHKGELKKRPVKAQDESLACRAFRKRVDRRKVFQILSVEEKRSVRS